MEPYQKRQFAKHPRVKKDLIGKGGNQYKAGPFINRPSFKRSKSAPPGISEGEEMTNEKTGTYKEKWDEFIAEANENVPQEARLEAITEELFYPVPSEEAVLTIIKTGIRDYNENSPLEAGTKEEGITFATQLKQVVKNSELVIVYSGQALTESGQYTFARDKDNTIKVFMKDSAANAGTGIEPRVDKLGTDIPFEFVVAIVFVKPIKRQRLSYYRNMINEEVPFLYYDQQTNQTKEYV